MVMGSETTTGIGQSSNRNGSDSHQTLSYSSIIDLEGYGWEPLCPGLGLLLSVVGWCGSFLPNPLRHMYPINSGAGRLGGVVKIQLVPTPGWVSLRLEDGSYHKI